MSGSADTARIRAAGAIALALLAGACAGANKSKLAATTQPRTYAIGPVGPGLAADDPGELTRWQNQMTREMRAGRPAPSNLARPGAASSRAAAAEARGASATIVAARSTPSFSESASAVSAGATAPAGTTAPGAAAVPTAAASPVLTRATLGGSAVRGAAAASQAARSPAVVRWLWALVAACIAALVFIAGRTLLQRRRPRSEPDLPLAPGPTRIERSRRTLYKPGPPPPRVTVLASARR